MKIVNAFFLVMIISPLSHASSDKDCEPVKRQDGSLHWSARAAACPDEARLVQLETMMRDVQKKIRDGLITSEIGVTEIRRLYSLKIEIAERSK